MAATKSSNSKTAVAVAILGIAGSVASIIALLPTKPEKDSVSNSNSAVFSDARDVSVNITATNSAAPNKDKGELFASKLLASIAAEEEGDVAKALDYAKEAFALRPNDPAAANTLAGLHGKLGDFESQETWAQNAIALDNRFWKAFINLGNSYGSRQHFDLAKINYSTAAELAPTEPLPLYSLAVTKECQNDISSAAALYKRAINLDAKYSTPSAFNLAVIRANQGNLEEAIKLLSAYTSANTDDLEAKDYLKQFILDHASKPHKSHDKSH